MGNTSTRLDTVVNWHMAFPLLPSAVKGVSFTITVTNISNFVYQDNVYIIIPRDAILSSNKQPWKQFPF